MANKKSSAKRVRQTIKKTARNRAAKSRMQTAIRRYNEAVAAEDQNAIAERLQIALKVVDKTETKGVIHKNKAARLKSRLVKHYNSLNE